MATAPDLKHAETGTDLIVQEAQRNAVALFTDDKQYSDFYERVKRSVADFVPDVTTDKGRREIASEAFKVTKAKTTLDKAGFALTEEWRQKTNAVNAARKKMTTELDALADEVRKPLTEWEEQEAARQARVDETIQRLRNSAIIGEEDTAATLEARLQRLEEFELDEDVFGVRIAEARDTRDASVGILQRAIARLRQEEADRAELERLRREAAERDEADRIQREEREREERERLQREADERATVEAEERRKAEIAEAEARARVEAEERVREEERAEAQRKYNEEQSRRYAAEEEAKRLGREAEEREAWEAKEKREREAREADERHRKAVIDEIIADIQDVTEGSLSGGDEALIAHAIAGGSIRHVSVTF